MFKRIYSHFTFFGQVATIDFYWFFGIYGPLWPTLLDTLCLKLKGLEFEDPFESPLPKFEPKDCHKRAPQAVIQVHFGVISRIISIFRTIMLNITVLNDQKLFFERLCM